MSARLAAYKLIERVEGSAYSNIALDSAFKDSSLSERDKAFAARLFYGVTERRITLEHLLSAYVTKPINKLDKQVRITLMMGAYQLLYMDNVPDNAAVSESVELVKKLKKASASGMVNAVLRNIIRDGKKLPEVKGDRFKKMSVEYSCPEELIRRICEGYGEENTRSLLENALLPSICTLRANTLKTSGSALADSLSGRGVKAAVSALDENTVICENLRDVEKDEDFIKGNYHAQDHSSQLCCKAVSPVPGETVIDLCAAPGGKTFTMAEMMENKGRIIACELHEKRTGLIRQGAERLGLGIVEAVTNDARVHDPKLPLADRVLCDVPCSGYGVIRGKPEIRYKPLSDADGLPRVQLEILLAAAEYVKDGGLLVYSTCTVNINENERVIEAFLEKRKDFSGEDFPEEMGDFFKGKFMTAVFAKDFGGDGFFICRLRKDGSHGD
ncbi:MAG: 16S rRNA (cytosine(967)-C(5))-methyltransferase RsmB [Huintestinicola sp.]|uniref:16S rRNA (cytosine(967)-C(5))-methyltransferase RsmB n=1 Tax=Huintestinicola sp. TaxID=2981661 RepID=UPI003F0A9F2E